MRERQARVEPGGFIAGLCAVGRNRDDGRMTSTGFLRKILIFAEELAP